jgi:hypothetical protein
MSSETSGARNARGERNLVADALLTGNVPQIAGAMAMRGVNQALDELVPAEAAEQLRTLIRDRVRAEIRRAGSTASFDRALRETIHEMIRAVCKELVREREQDIDSALRAYIDERWKADVEAVARLLLDEHLAGIRRRLSGAP